MKKNIMKLVVLSAILLFGLAAVAAEPAKKAEMSKNCPMQSEMKKECKMVNKDCPKTDKECPQDPKKCAEYQAKHGKKDCPKDKKDCPAPEKCPMQKK